MARYLASVLLLVALSGLELSASATHLITVQDPFKRQQHLDPTLVQTSSGTVKGHTASWPNNTNVIEFLGIPYAQPPVGDLRFAAPRALVNASGNMINGNHFSMDCMQFTGNANQSLGHGVSPKLQAYGYGMGGGSADAPHSYGEDCLTANIWTKPTGPPSKAVMVWIYGGGFSAGTSNAPFYSGARLANDEEVVVVSFNYRISIFGFPNAPGIADQNAGLLDQRMAVEWVRDNIAAFGGDPNRITLFGESAGGASVDLYAFAWTADPIVNGFIAQSGSVSLAQSPVNNALWYNASSALGCGGAEAGDATVACMQTKNATDIINAVGNITSGKIAGGFGPAADGKVVFSDVGNRSVAGNFIKKPLLIGSNDFELGLIRGLPAGLGFGRLPANASDEQLQAASDIAFSCGAARAARDRTANGVPAWRYRYMAVWDNVALTNTTGCYHSSEIPIALGTNPLRPNSTADVPEEAKLEAAMVHAWAEFAKDPTGGLTNLGWPTYNVNGSTLVRLGFQNLSTLNFGPSVQYDSLCSLPITP